MRNFLLIFSASFVFSLKCFSSEHGAVQTVDDKLTVCLLELNLYNLGCLPPVPLKFDVETVFATFGKPIRKGTTVCFQEDHYVKCECRKNECNKHWNGLNSTDLVLNLDENIAQCLAAKCINGYTCYSYGMKESRAFNHYEIPQKNTVTSTRKKSTIVNIIEDVILWLVGCGILLSLGLLIVYESIRRDGLGPIGKLMNEREQMQVKSKISVNEATIVHTQDIVTKMPQNQTM